MLMNKLCVTCISCKVILGKSGPLNYTTLKDLPIILRDFEQPFGFYMSLRCSKLISLNCEGAKNCILIQLHAINSQGKAVNLRNTDKKGGGVKPHSQPDCKMSDFSSGDFPQGRCRNDYFWRNMHPWCRGNWVVQGKSYNGPKKFIGFTWCKYCA